MCTLLCMQLTYTEQAAFDEALSPSEAAVVEPEVRRNAAQFRVPMLEAGAGVMQKNCLLTTS